MKVKLLLLVVLTLSCLLPVVEGAVHTETFIIEADETKSGCVLVRDVNFTVAWTAENGTEMYLLSELDPTLVGLNKWGGKYLVIRHFYWFDTRDIKKNMRVTSAYLQAYSYYTRGGTNWIAKMQKWTDTDGSLGLTDYTAFDEFFYDDNSFEEADFVTYEYNDIPIRDDTLIKEKGDTKLCFRISDEVNGFKLEYTCGLNIGWVAHPPKLLVNVEWAYGKVKPRGLDFLPFAILGVAICGGISYVAIQKDKWKRRLYQ